MEGMKIYKYAIERAGRNLSRKQVCYLPCVCGAAVPAAPLFCHCTQILEKPSSVFNQLHSFFNFMRNHACCASGIYVVARLLHCGVVEMMD